MKVFIILEILDIGHGKSPPDATGKRIILLDFIITLGSE